MRRQQRREGLGAEANRALVQQYRADGKQYTPAERAGKCERGEAIEHRFDRQLVDIAGQAIFERPENGERANAKHQTGRDECFAEARAVTREQMLQAIP